MILQSKLRVITHLIHSKRHHKKMDKSNCIRLDLKEHTNLRSYKDYSSHKLIYLEINKCLIKKKVRERHMLGLSTNQQGLSLTIGRIIRYMRYAYQRFQLLHMQVWRRWV